ncbi:hypothetical protein ACVW1A_001629 [Bradyrhizobium sp. LB1.3]
MAKKPASSDKSGKSPKAKAPNSKAPNSKASRPDVQPIGPALAELLNPAINRGDAGLGSGTGLQPPPDNSRDRRSGGEAAAHRARASTPREFPQDTARTNSRPMPLRPNPQPPGGARRGLRRGTASQLRNRGHDPDARSGTGPSAWSSD